MKLPKWIGIVAGFLVVLSRPPAEAQELWQADVRIERMDLSGPPAPGQTELRVVVSSANDDEARQVRLEVLLPVGTRTIKVPRECREGLSPVSHHVGRVGCGLGSLQVGTRRDLRFTFVFPGGQASRRLAAVAWSDTPDPDLENNVAHRTAP